MFTTRTGYACSARRTWSSRPSIRSVGRVSRRTNIRTPSPNTAPAIGGQVGPRTHRVVEGKERRVHRRVRGEPGQRRTRPGVDRGLRADGLRHGCHHGRAPHTTNETGNLPGNIDLPIRSGCEHRTHRRWHVATDVCTPGEGARRWTRSSAVLSLDGLSQCRGKEKDHRRGSKPTAAAKRKHQLQTARLGCSSRQRYWGEPFPDHLAGTASIPPCPKSELPLPAALTSTTNKTHRHRRTTARQGHRTGCAIPMPPRARRTPCRKWAGSCWYYPALLRPAQPGAFRRARKPSVIGWTAASPGGGRSLRRGGTEHAVLHLLYARFLAQGAL